MFGLMYLNTTAMDHVFFNDSRLDGAGVRWRHGRVMLFMRGMYDDSRKNTAIP
jgi:hypothetical protein